MAVGRQAQAAAQGGARLSTQGVEPRGGGVGWRRARRESDRLHGEARRRGPSGDAMGTSRARRRRWPTGRAGRGEDRGGAGGPPWGAWGEPGERGGVDRSRVGPRGRGEARTRRRPAEATRPAAVEKAARPAGGGDGQAGRGRWRRRR